MRFVILFLVGLLTSPRGDQIPSPAPEPSRTDILAEFPIASDYGDLIVPVTFRGQTYSFMIDTGASSVVYDQSFADQLGPVLESKRIPTLNGKAKVTTHAAPDAMLGPLNLRTDESVTCADLSPSGLEGQQRIYGLIGMSWLKNFVLTLDFTHKQIQLRHKVTINEQQALPLRFDGLGLPLIDVTVRGDDPHPYVLDTGNLHSTVVEQTTFDRLMRLGRLHYLQPAIVTDLSKAELVRSGWIDSVRIAGVKLTRIPVIEKPKSGGMLGLDTISRLDWVLDFPKGKMVVTRAGK